MTSRDKAQRGLTLLKEAISELLTAKKEGLTNAEISTELDIQSDYLGAHQGYFCWSILGLLLNEKRIVKKGQRYFIGS